MRNPFALAVWIIENNTPDACAPFYGYLSICHIIWLQFFDLIL
ncbi:MAG: hypothetical protein SPJ17_04985 [Anaeroplasma sp.]|nr:hypothetical protein [Anaeroplasma sp.]MDY5983031.1 hypothetical protein [Anaeroplasma sp.]